MENLKVRNAAADDMDRLMEIYARARKFMAENGNPTQWVGGYPSRELLTGDLTAGHLKVCTREDGEVVAAFCFMPGPDPTYGFMEEGSWLDDEPYHVVHRLASDGSVHGIGRACLDWCRSQDRHLRVDTHRDNALMHHLLRRYGMVRCGVIYAPDGTRRVAYQLPDDSLVERCFRLAMEALDGKRDFDGNALILHAMTVALMGETVPEKCLGALHDVVEDTDWTFEDLLERGVPADLVGSLRLLTHDPGISYEAYVQKILDSGDELALRVKRNDLTHNLSRGKACGYLRLVRKHGTALALVEERLCQLPVSGRG